MMQAINKISMIYNRLVESPAFDPDDSRRRKILNSILVFVVILTILVIITTAIWVIQGHPFLTVADIFAVGVALLVGSISLYYLNRVLPGWIASSLFLFFLMFVFAFSDTPKNLVDGRSLLVFAIPIIMTSMLLRPAYSFLAAGVVIVELFIIVANSGQVIEINYVTMAIFFMVAAISWLSSRSLELTLKDLRSINANLDRRVEERTQALSGALAREVVEAGKNQAILASIADGVVVFDEQGTSIVANHAMSQMLAAPQETLVGAPIDQIFNTRTLALADLNAIRSLLTRSERAGPSVRFRYGQRTLLANAAPVHTTDNRSIGTVAVFRDFTREAEVEQMKNTFVATVSHELRTPLNAILGYAEMVRESVYGPLSPSQGAVMERIEFSSRRLLGLVSDLLDQAQIEAGRLRIHNEEFATSELSEVLHTMMDQPAHEKGLSFSISKSSDLPSKLYGDSRRIQQILINLVGNAFKFTSTGGVQVYFRLADPGYWAFDVQDTGSGIPLEAQEYVFETFRQTDQGATREHGGVGLGLSIVRSLASLMGGTVSLNSQLGRGSTFTVVLPLQPAMEA